MATTKGLKSRTAVPTHTGRDQPEPAFTDTDHRDFYRHKLRFGRRTGLSMAKAREWALDAVNLMRAMDGLEPWTP